MNPKLLIQQEDHWSATRWVYFLQDSSTRKLIKIGVANDVIARIAQLRRRHGELHALGVMCWRDDYPDTYGRYGNAGILAPYRLWGGRGGTARMAERLIHQLFDAERVDKRRKQPFGTRHEWFRPSKRLMSFIEHHTIGLSAGDHAPQHELQVVEVLAVAADGLALSSYIDLELPEYLAGRL